MNKKILILLLCCIITNISETLYAEELKYENPHVFAYPFEKVWLSVVTLLQKSGVIIRDMNKDSGFIATDWSTMGGGIGKVFTQALVGETYLYRFTYLIIPINENSTSVQVKCSLGLQNVFGRVEPGDYISGEGYKDNELAEIKALDFFLLGQPSVTLGIEQTKYKEKLDRLKILKVKEKSLAKKAGIRAFDVLLRVNNDEITNEKEALIAMNKIKPGDTFTVTVSRNDNIKKFTITAPQGGKQ